MISNLLVNQQKFVLFIDNVGMENQSFRLIQKWLTEQNISMYELLNIRSRDDGVVFEPKLTRSKECGYSYSYKISSEKVIAILKPVSKILYEYAPEALFDLVNSLKRDPDTKQIFAWATVKNIQEHFVIPFLEHMADITVNISDTTNLSILTRKQGGLVSKKYYTYDTVDQVFEVSEVTKPIQKPSEPPVKPESLGTFKINLNEDEIIARNTLKLPYEKNSEEKNESNIEYTPDSDDDFDDEDPDEDLYI